MEPLPPMVHLQVTEPLHVETIKHEVSLTTIEEAAKSRPAPLVKTTSREIENAGSILATIAKEAWQDITDILTEILKFFIPDSKQLTAPKEFANKREREHTWTKLSSLPKQVAETRATQQSEARGQVVQASTLFQPNRESEEIQFTFLKIGLDVIQESANLKKEEIDKAERKIERFSNEKYVTKAQQERIRQAGKENAIKAENDRHAKAIPELKAFVSSLEPSVRNKLQEYLRKPEENADFLQIYSQTEDAESMKFPSKTKGVISSTDLNAAKSKTLELLAKYESQIFGP